MLQLPEFVKLYVQLGFKPVPLRPFSKIPVYSKWNKNWNEIECLSYFSMYPNSNIGLLLGDIIDVEGDNQEANKLIEKLIGKKCPHPIYKSAKSVHHLFLNHDKTLTRLVAEGIPVEFRGYGHQSVVPPSFHEDGIQYEWISPITTTMPTMPDALMEFYQSETLKKQKKVGFSKNHVSKKDAVEQYTKNYLKFRYDVKPGSMKIWCGKCKSIKFIHRKRLKLEKIAFAEMGLGWLCNQCRDVDLRNICRKIRKKI